jgi:hypothetical protein
LFTVLSSSERIRIRVRSGQNEAEIEASPDQIREAIALISEITSKFPEGRSDMRQMVMHSEPAPAQAQPDSNGAMQLPAIAVEKGDSLSDIISKFFADQWGKVPRKLSDVREVLQSYGLNYPKQSVAVALLRLAKASKIRRFKGEAGEYVYTASTSAMMSPSMPAQVLILPDSDTEETLTETEGAANI